MKRLAWLFALCPMLSFGMDRLEALSMIESGGNDRMVGRHGEVSRYQILKREWRSVTQSAKYANPAVAREVTRTLLDQRVHAFERTHGRSPTDFEFYGLWNAPSQVLSGRVSPVVAERCRRYANLCSIGSKPAPPITPVPTVSPVMLAQAPASLR